MPVGGERKRRNGEESYDATEKVRIDKKEVFRVKRTVQDIGLSGMQLMGFKDKDHLKIYHNLGHSTFVVPDEKRASGSSACVDALIKEMQRRDKLAIVKFRPKEDSQIRFCALTPQEAEMGQPAGFHLIVLPYADDIRSTEEMIKKADLKKEAVVDTLTKEEKNAAKLLIKNLNFDFDSHNFRNTSLQQFFSRLQAKALGEKPEEIDDTLEPRREEMARFGEVFARFESAFGVTAAK
jgi:ATP-dependent DNA helicase 2 subunit 1